MEYRWKYTLRLVAFLILIFFIGLVTACAPEPSTPVATMTATVDSAGTPAVTEASDVASEAGEEAVPEGVVDVATAVAERTPVPTPTPSRVDREIAQLTGELGLSGKTFLGITVEDWFDLAISAFIVLVGYFLGVRLLTAILSWIARRTSTEIDEALLEHLAPDLKWLAVLYVTRFAVFRLDFLSDVFRKMLEDVFFGLGLVVFATIGHRLIKYGADWYKANLESDEERLRLTPLIMSVQRILNLILMIILLSIGLSHFGINLGVLSIAVLVLALILSLGAKDVISDAISGFVIIIDQPFRVNDGIKIEDYGTWGDVVAIGTRTTRILTRDNREVIIPNTRLLNSRIINYTYPSPEVRMQVELHIAYDSDLDEASRVIVDALNKVEVVLPDKGVEVLLVDFSDTARKLLVRWWVADYHQPWKKVDMVCRAIDAALDEAGIEIPITVYDLNVRMESRNSVSKMQEKVEK
ncbi:MAG: mechanosensitive ion channel [Anaerolineales bacterium]|jgi:small-conductance mechanosensitive channel